MAASELFTALERVLDGRAYITPLMADLLKLAPRTIAFHKYTMIEQLGFKTGAELVQYAVRLGLVGPGLNAADSRKFRKT